MGDLSSDLAPLFLESFDLLRETLLFVDRLLGKIRLTPRVVIDPKGCGADQDERRENGKQ
jgi:hypothetical protein